MVGPAILAAVLLADRVARQLAMFGIDIADRDDLDVIEAQKPVQVSPSLPARADAAHDDALAGSARPILSQRRGGDDGWQAGCQSRGRAGAFQEFSSRPHHGERSPDRNICSE